MDRDHILATSFLSVIFRLRSLSGSADRASFLREQGSPTFEARISCRRASLGEPPGMGRPFGVARWPSDRASRAPPRALPCSVRGPIESRGLARRTASGAGVERGERRKDKEPPHLVWKTSTIIVDNRIGNVNAQRQFDSIQTDPRGWTTSLPVAEISREGVRFRVFGSAASRYWAFFAVPSVTLLA
jgi:hypothetical protein